MIFHLVGNHGASKNFVNQFVSSFPNDNIIAKIDNKEKTVELSIREDYFKYNSIKEFKQSFDCSLVSIIVVHFLDYRKTRFLSKCFSEDIPVIWWMYGQDLYSRLFEKGYNLYAPQTLPYTRPKNLIRKIRRLRFEVLKKYFDKKVLHRIKGVIPCEYPDYKLACDLVGKKLDLVDIYTRNLLPSYEYYTSGKDICIGHSASMTSNHLYALNYLKKIDLDDSEIWMPLSYTVQSERYREAVIEEYKAEFKNRIHFMLDFQDLDTYKKNFYKYKVAIYSSWRQEALYNIFSCFLVGVKVILSKNNPCYGYFKEIGYIVFTLEELVNSDDLLPLTQSEKEHNRQLFLQIKANRENVSPINLKNYFSKYV